MIWKMGLRVWLLVLVVVLVGCQGEEREGTAEGDTPVAVATVAATGLVSTEVAPMVETAEPTQMAATAGAGETDTPPTPTVEAVASEEVVARPVTGITLVPVVGGFDQPVHLTHAFDERLFVVEQAGVIRVVADGVVMAEPFLDIRQRVGSESNEQGLLSAAFHPDYANNGLFFVYYTDKAGDTVVARYQVSGDEPNRANGESEMVVLAIEQPYPNHNGGQLQFGPDGYLYIGMGDGGSGGDPEGHGQDRSTLLGDLLRIDVNGAAPYTIPADNPYIFDEVIRDEIWAWGLRNPWRFSFDRLTGDLYVADVGQGEWEEINFQAAGSSGVNYGWNIMEGTHCFRSQSCDEGGLVRPVAEYSHDQGCSVTGGYMYRGSQFPTLAGNYFFGDYCSGIVWSLLRDGDGRWQQNVVLDSDYLISTFGEDAAGELYLADRSSGTIFQIQP